MVAGIRADERDRPHMLVAAGFMVVAAGVLATIGASMQWYAPARSLVSPDLSGVALSAGVVLVATVGMAGLGLAIAFAGRAQAGLVAAVAAAALLAAVVVTVQNVAALNEVPSGVHYSLEVGVWLTATAGVLGLLGSLTALTVWLRIR